MIVIASTAGYVRWKSDLKQNGETGDWSFMVSIMEPNHPSGMHPLTMFVYREDEDDAKMLYDRIVEGVVILAPQVKVYSSNKWSGQWATRAVVNGRIQVWEQLDSGEFDKRLQMIREEQEDDA